MYPFNFNFSEILCKGNGGCCGTITARTNKNDRADPTENSSAVIF